MKTTASAQSREANRKTNENKSKATGSVSSRKTNENKSKATGSISSIGS